MDILGVSVLPSSARVVVRLTLFDPWTAVSHTVASVTTKTCELPNCCIDIKRPVVATDTSLKVKDTSKAEQTDTQFRSIHKKWPSTSCRNPIISIKDVQALTCVFSTSSMYVRYENECRAASLACSPIFGVWRSGDGRGTSHQHTIGCHLSQTH